MGALLPRRADALLRFPATLRRSASMRSMTLLGSGAGTAGGFLPARLVAINFLSALS
jgi:hypothetical protein